MTDEDFARLYEALSPAVFSFASRRVGAHAAHDVVAETFEVAWRKRDEFPDDKAAWPAWVVGIAKNKVLQELQRRTRKHHDNRFTEDWAGHARDQSRDDVSSSVISNDLGRRIYQSLSPAERLLFDVAFFRDLRPVDAARVLGCSVTAFTSRLSRLRQRLRDLEAAHEADREHSEGVS